MNVYWQAVSVIDIQDRSQALWYEGFLYNNRTFLMIIFNTMMANLYIRMVIELIVLLFINGIEKGLF